MPSPYAILSAASLNCARLCALAAILLCALPQGTAHAAALPDFEDDVSLNLDEGQLRKLGAKACPQAALCLDVLWAGQEWKATLRMHGGKLDVVELHPKGLMLTSAAKEQLEEFALAPVRVKAGDVQCDAFALRRAGKSAEQAVDICAEKLDKVPGGTQSSVWYVDEDAVEDLLRAESLESAGSSHARTVAARLSVAPGGIEVGYGHLGSLLQPSFKP